MKTLFYLIDILWYILLNPIGHIGIFVGVNLMCFCEIAYKKSNNFRGWCGLLSFVLFVKMLVFCIDLKIQIKKWQIFTVCLLLVVFSHYCLTLVGLSAQKKTILITPDTLWTSPMPGTCNTVVIVFFMFFLILVFILIHGCHKCVWGTQPN